MASLIFLLVICDHQIQSTLQLTLTVEFCFQFYLSALIAFQGKTGNYWQGVSGQTIWMQCPSMGQHFLSVAFLLYPISHN